MTYSDVIAHFGSVLAAAERIGIRDKAIYKWKKKRIPYERQCQIQALTDNILTADEPFSDE